VIFFRYFIEISYDGTPFYGWQRQLGQISVQEAVEIELQKLFSGQEIAIVGCGRTDAGVHAKQYFFHVDFENEINTNQLSYKLNSMLPQAISVQSVFLVDSTLHARFSATKRTYRYFIHQQKNPFLLGKSTYFAKELEINKMQEACGFLLGTQDFSSFAKVHTDVKTHICTVYSASWHEENGQLVFEISADRFLRNMVRSIVGTLLDIGTGKIALDELPTIIDQQNRSAASQSIAACGLFLWKIEYPFV
jgi:tRNA pseudouridine38-40 synthase